MGMFQDKYGSGRLLRIILNTGWHRLWDELPLVTPPGGESAVRPLVVTCIAFRKGPCVPPGSFQMATSNEEREMSIYQRGLVDTCFEEGQYESGIAVLDQLRSASFKPPPQVSLDAILVPELIAFR